MAWDSPDAWPTRLFAGDLLTILIAIIVTFSLPVLVHLFFFATSTQPTTTNLFVLLGPSGSGKTSLLSLLQGKPSEDDSNTLSTRTSQISSSPVSLQLSPSIPLGSNRHRSNHDDSHLISTPYKLIDTPGHGKLRPSQALSHLSDPALQGIIFLVDAATLDNTETSTLPDSASYLHDVLLTLQRRKTNKATTKSKSKSQATPSVLVAANKQDLFTALPSGAVRERLELEIERVKMSRSRGLGTVGDDAEDEPEEALGGDLEEKFSFSGLKEEYGIRVDVIGGSVSGEEAGKGVRQWEEWVGGCL